MSDSGECVYKLKNSKRGKVWETDCGHRFSKELVRQCKEEGICIICDRRIVKVREDGGASQIPRSQAEREGECCYEAEEGGKFWKTECDHRFNGQFMVKWTKECEGGDFFCPVCRKMIVIWD
jgi:hypothetical protein